MGKLAELRKELRDCTNDIRCRDIEKEIHKIEQWCIDNNKGNITKLTLFRIDAGEEDINKCGLCQAKGRSPPTYKQRIHNGKTRRVCQKCFIELEKGVNLYNERNGTKITL